MSCLVVNFSESQPPCTVKLPRGVTCSDFGDRAEFEFKLPFNLDSFSGILPIESYNNPLSAHEREMKILSTFSDYFPFGYSFQPPNQAAAGNKTSAAKKISTMNLSFFVTLLLLIICPIFFFHVLSLLKNCLDTSLLVVLYVLLIIGIPLSVYAGTFWNLQKNKILLRISPNILEVVYGNNFHSYKYMKNHIKNVFYKTEKIEMLQTSFKVFTIFADIEYVGRIELVSGITNAEFARFLSKKIRKMMGLRKKSTDISVD